MAASVELRSECLPRRPLTLWFGLRGVGTKLRGEATVGGARGGRFGLRNGLRTARVGDELEGLGLAFGVKFHFGSFAVGWCVKCERPQARQLWLAAMRPS